MAEIGNRKERLRDYASFPDRQPNVTQRNPNVTQRNPSLLNVKTPAERTAGVFLLPLVLVIEDGF